MLSLNQRVLWSCNAAQGAQPSHWRKNRFFHVPKLRFFYSCVNCSINFMVPYRKVSHYGKLERGEGLAVQAGKNRNIESNEYG